jgi:hypothetical protein
MEFCCSCCGEEVNSLVPVVNRDPGFPSEYQLVCEACIEVDLFEHADELLWSPVTFESLNTGRIRLPVAA